MRRFAIHHSGRRDGIAWAVIAVVAGALLLRLVDLDVRAIHHDESLHATYSWYFVNAAPLYRHDPLMHGPFQFHAMALSFLLLGDSDFAARLPAALAGAALVATPLLLRHWLGGVGTVTAAALLALSPSLLYYSRFAREDIYAALWTALLVIAVWRYREEGRDRWLALAAAALGLAFATKESAYLTAAILLLYCDVTLTLALLDRRGTTGSARWRERLLLAPVAWLVAGLWDLLDPLRVRLRFSPPASETDEGADETASIAGPPRPLTSMPREGQLLLVIGVLTLPQLAAAVQLPLAALGMAVEGETERLVSVLAVSVLLAITVAVGVLWDVRRWLLVVLVFYGITLPLFTTEFTNVRGGITSDLWGALDYWIAQQDVRRGEQPLYYYVMMLPLYELLVLVPAAVGGWVLVRRGERVAALLAWWALGTMLALTQASEKMPWLLVHQTLPLALLAALVVDRAVSAARARARDSMAVGAVGAVAGATWLLLAVISVRTAVGVSFAHPDTPVEPLIYTQTAPDVPRIARTLQALSAEHPDMSIVVDGGLGLAWPWAWYLRDLPNVSYPSGEAVAAAARPTAALLVLPESINEAVRAGRVTKTYHHRWWFPEEGYRGLTGSRLWDGIRSGELPGAWIEFVTRHIAVDQIGAQDAEFLLPVGTAPADTTPDGAAAGPQPSTPPR